MSSEDRTRSERIVTGLSQFIKFGIVGGSGVVVNLAVIVLVKKIAGWTAGITEYDALINLFGTEWNIRWYHVFMTIAFLFANIWNYQLNRMWTFKGISTRSWFRGFFPFLLAGLGAFLVSQVVATLLMNPYSPVALPPDIFDDSTGFRTKFYWASAISILISMPANFLINKFWTFRRPKILVVADQSPQ